VAGDEDDREGCLAGDQFLLQFEPAHARHAHVEDRHGDGGRVVAGEEFLGALEPEDPVAARFEQPLQRVAHRVVIVDDVHHTQRFSILSHVRLQFRRADCR
jgi:hypothetical protein